MSTQISQPYSWVPFYEELADKLVGYRHRQTDLINFAVEMRRRGFPTTSMEDKDDTGARSLLAEIDPFTFLGTFNRGISNEKRIGILSEVKRTFGLEAPVPSDFSGIPVLNNQNSWFFAYKVRRQPGDIDRLWDVFNLALGPKPMEDPAFQEAFDRALEVRFTNVNLTMGLFWIRPRQFLSLDSTMREHLSIALPKGGLSFASYQDVLREVGQTSKGSFHELSFEAWTSRPTPTLAPPRDDTDFWIVGAYWDGSEPADQTDRFIAEGVWENGYEDKYLDEVRQMKTGDRIAIKAASTQRSGLPFDNSGKTASRMSLKARGTIVRNRNDGQTVEVEWEDLRKAPRDWYFYTFRGTVWKLRKDDDLAHRLIRFAFFDEPQDYAFFADKVRGASMASEPQHDGHEAELPSPYSLADIVAEGVFMGEQELGLALKRLETKGALILQGAPGVGKTFLALRLAYALMQARDTKRATMIQFHPSYTYEDFVRGYRPGSEAGRFELTDGPFMMACKAAQDDPDHRHVLIIDEINRGHLGQIFGELFMLLEMDKRGPSHAITPLYRRTHDEKFYCPRNLFVIGTMNLADRSLALVDFALRRRFAFLTMEPRFTDPRFRLWLRDRKMPDSISQRIQERMGALNERIEKDAQLGPGFRIGHSFFCPHGDDFSGLDETWFQQVVTTEIQPLLEEYWYDAPETAKNATGDLLR